MVRTKDKAEQVKKAYPSARIVLGDLDASDVLEAEAAQADIILRALKRSHGSSSTNDLQMQQMLRIMRVQPTPLQPA